MYNYQISIGGIHCPGCGNLISICLEEAEFTDIVVDQAQQVARFKSAAEIAEVEEAVQQIFATDLTDYHFSNLILTD